MTDQHQHDERPMRSSTSAVFDRVQKVESDVASVREQIAGMNVNLTSQGQTLTRIAMTLDQRGATDWKAIWSAASVMLAIIALGATLVLQPIRQQADANRLAIQGLNDMKVLEARAALQDARDELRDAQERGRYRERVDRMDRELMQLERGRLQLERGAVNE